MSVPGDGSALTLAVLQGLLADRSDKNLLFRAASYEKWVPYTGAAVLEAQEDGSPWDLPSLLSLFAPLFDGYLLCDSESAPFAVAVAKQKNSLPVYPEFEETVKEAGLTLTKAGATFPYGKDPRDSNMRIAPSLPPIGQLEQAMEIYCVCLRLAAIEHCIWMTAD